MTLPVFDVAEELNKPYRVLVYGPPGAGKTWGALTFPRPNVIDFDQGMAVGAHPKFIAQWGRPSIFGRTFIEGALDKRGVPTAHQAFDEACEYVEFSLSPENKDSFDTWIVDSGTSLSRAALFTTLHVLDKGWAGTKSDTLKGAQRTGLIAPKQQDFGAQRSLVEQFISKLKDSGKMLVLICHQYTEFGEDGDIAPLLTGGSRAAVPAMFHEVYNIRPEGVGSQRKVLTITEQEGRYQVKSRLGIPTRTLWTWPAINSALDTRRKEVGLTSAPSGAKE